MAGPTSGQRGRRAADRLLTIILDWYGCVATTVKVERVGHIGQVNYATELPAASSLLTSYSQAFPR